MPTSPQKPPWPVARRELGLFPDRLCFVPRDLGGTKAPDLGPLRRDGTLAGTAAYARGGRWGGPIVSHLATGDSTSFGLGSLFLPSADITILLGYRKRDATLRGSAAFGTASSVSQDRCSAFVPYSDGIVYWDYGGTSGAFRASASGLTFGDDIWAFTAGPRGQEIWQNGSRRAVSAGAASRGNTAFAWGLGIQDSLTSDLADYSFLYIYGRQLSTADLARLLADPFLPVRPPPRMPILSSAVAPAANPAALLCCM